MRDDFKEMIADRLERGMTFNESLDKRLPNRKNGLVFEEKAIDGWTVCNYKFMINHDTLMFSSDNPAILSNPESFIHDITTFVSKNGVVLEASYGTTTN